MYWPGELKTLPQQNKAQQNHVHIFWDELFITSKSSMIFVSVRHEPFTVLLISINFPFYDESLYMIEPMSQLDCELIIQIFDLYMLLLWKKCWCYQIITLHIPQQQSCCDMCKAMTWLNHYRIEISTKILCAQNLIYEIIHFCEMGPRCQEDLFIKLVYWLFLDLNETALQGRSV